MKVLSYLALGLAWLSLAPCALAQPPGKGERALAAFQNALKQDGFDVTTGATVAINVVRAWCDGKTPLPGFAFDHALYSNNQPYLGLLVPKSAQEPGHLTGIFQLDPAEAIVLIGQTPPPQKYFGFYPFLRTRVNADGVRQSLWATLGDAVNNATVKTTGPTPFNSPVALIFTPDQGTDARVRAALRRAGYPSAIFNTLVLPAPMLNLGHSQTADEFFIAVRNAMWQNQSEGDAYIQNPPLHLFRVTPRVETIADPFPVPRLRVRGTGQTEMDLMDRLALLRQRLVEANSGLHATDLATRPNFYEGYDYIQRGVDPWGDSRDAFFLTAGYLPEFSSPEKVTLADDEFLMVYGANHVATGKATYHSVNVYSSSEGKVPIGDVDDRMFPGTAAPYLPGDPAANLMYAFKISRNCGNEPNCVTLALDNCPRLTIDSNTVLGLIFRMYLEPATKVGAAMPEVLYDRVIKFSPRAPAQPVTLP
jgi:hypothetical protein